MKHGLFVLSAVCAARVKQVGATSGSNAPIRVVWLTPFSLTMIHFRFSVFTAPAYVDSGTTTRVRDFCVAIHICQRELD
ncbi:hypothetical protein Y032_0008g161 [Ancylostoma ceylanicum]|uniref:Secreted protein n=1 Tax=Ancylostoma ceylanicum TaxID=53326 RepID=A0A016VJG2_9BILA|nr:hypothetical protein Y032_0008g161 [Ancylostoma ceylanicum]